MNKKSIIGLTILPLMLTQLMIAPNVFKSNNVVHAAQISSDSQASSLESIKDMKIFDTTYEEFYGALNTKSDEEISDYILEVSGSNQLLPGVKDPLYLARVLITFGLGEHPIAGSSLSTFFGMLLPFSVDSTDTETKINRAWLKMRQEIEKMIDKNVGEAFNKYEIDTMNSKLKGLNANSKTYVQRVNNLVLKDDSLAQTELKKTELVRQTDIYLSLLRNAVPQFQKEEYGVLVLPYFTQVAYLHLAVLRDIVLNSKKWDLPISEANYNNRKKEFYDCLKKYREYIKTTYEKGKTQIIERENNSGINDVGKTYKGYSTYKKARLNSYERFMQLHVFDYVSMWPYLDPASYDGRTNFEQSREIFSDPSGDLFAGEVDGIPNKPEMWQDLEFGDDNYYGELKNIFYNRKDYTDFYGRVHENVAYSAMNSYVKSGDKKEVLSNKYTSSEREYVLPIKDNIVSEVTSFIDRDKFNRAESASAFEVKLSSGKSYSAGIPFYADEEHKISYPGNKLSRVKLNFKEPKNNETKLGHVFGFRPITLSPNNNIDSDKTYVFSSQKCKNDPIGFNPQKEYAFGGNGMETSDEGSLEYKVNSKTRHKYKIRYRLASKNGVKLKTYLGIDKLVQDLNIESTTNDPKAEKGIYGNYKLIDGPTVDLKEGENIIKLFTNAGDVSIVNIEFVPVN